MAREAETIAIDVRIVFRTEGESADIAGVFEITRIDDVVRAAGAFAQALSLYRLHVAGKELAQPMAAESAPAKFDAHTEAAARLDACGFLRVGG